MILFKSKLRRKIEAEILKLRMDMSEVKKQKALTPAHHTRDIVDLIIRQKAIEKKIELYRKLLNE